MDRKIMNSKAFTLVEVIVVMVLIGLISLIAIPKFSKWTGKRDVENDIKMLYSFLENARIKAFTEKRNYEIEFVPVSSSGNEVVQIVDGNIIDRLKTKYNLTFNSGTKVSITSRGVYSTSTSIFSNEFNKNPEYTCLVISPLRVRLGKWDGSACNVK